MIKIGTNHTLEFIRETNLGYKLDGGDAGEILMPRDHAPEGASIGDQLEVFVYKNYDDDLVATSQTPNILLHEFALLRTESVNEIGAFMDIGLDKQLLVPFSEQRKELEENRWYIIYMDLEEKNERLYGTNKIEKRLNHNPEGLEEKQEVDILVYQMSDLGYNVIVNNEFKGLVYDNEIFKELNIGQKMKGYIKKVREDGKLDISLKPIGYRATIVGDHGLILQRLQEEDGFLPINDKSSPDDIYDEFGMSKKAFKRAVGKLYKERKIAFEDQGIKLL